VVLKLRLSKCFLVGCAVVLACSYDASRLRAPGPDAAVGGSGGSGGGDVAMDSAPDVRPPDRDAPVEAEPQDALDVPYAPDLRDAGDAPITEAPVAQVDVSEDAVDAPLVLVDTGEDVLDAPEDAVDAPTTEVATAPMDVQGEAGSVVEAGEETGSGGALGTGGVTGTGGTLGTGGTSGAGGASGTGGTTTTLVGTTVTFLNGMAQGAMAGYSCVSLGILDSLTSPTCGGAQIKGLTPSDPALTFNSSCAPANITWNSTTALCATGSIPAWPPNPSDADYRNNWGVLIGVNAGEPAQAIGTAYRSITFTLTGQPMSGLRAIVHLRSDPGNITYCYDTTTTGSPIYFTSFNTECWHTGGAYLSSSDVARIDQVGVAVVASNTSISVRNLCLTRITFAR
jgi:hypothetical protein